MATKKLTPVKAAAPVTAAEPTIAEPTIAELTDTIQTLTNSLDSITRYLHGMDWKLWMLMNMVRLIGEENGYSFKTLDSSKDSKDYGDEV